MPMIIVTANDRLYEVDLDAYNRCVDASTDYGMAEEWVDLEATAEWVEQHGRLIDGA